LNQGDGEGRGSREGEVLAEKEKYWQRRGRSKKALSSKREEVNKTSINQAGVGNLPYL
jgi:hypothetical protein